MPSGQYKKWQELDMETSENTTNELIIRIEEKYSTMKVRKTSGQGEELKKG